MERLLGLEGDTGRICRCFGRVTTGETTSYYDSREYTTHVMTGNVLLFL